MRVVDYVCEEKSERLFSEKAGFEQCARYFYDDSVFADTVKEYFLEDEKYKAILNSFKILKSHNHNFSMTREVSKKLFGNDMRISASQIEKFYLCKFQYFCCYGMGAKKRKPAVFDALEYGNLMHFVLEQILSQNVTEQDVSEKINQSLHKYVEDKLGGLENKTARFKYLFLRLSNSIEIVTKYIFQKSQQNNFKPVDFEIPVKDGGSIVPLIFSVSEGGTVKIEGKIDRVDLMKKDDKTYLRIVDYKSGVKHFKLSDILYGVNMQMLIYLANIVKTKNLRYGDVIPAGVLYMPTSLSVSNIDGETKNLESLDKKRLDAQFKMNGLVLDDPDVVVEMNKDSKTDTVVSLAEMGAVLKKVETLAVEMSETLRDGNISAKPTIGEINACEYCVYSSVCGRDNENDVCKIEKISDREVIEKIMKEEI